MSELSPRDRYLNTLLGKKVDRVSCSCPLQTATMELMEKTGSYWPQAHKDASKMADLSYGAWKYAGIESVRVPFCLTVEAEALGCSIDIENPSSQPSVQKHVLDDKSKLDSLEVPDSQEDFRMPVVGEAVSILKERVGDELPVIAGIVSPFTLAGHLRGVENLLMDTFDDPEFVEELTSFTKEVAVEYARYLEWQGADSICLIDPSATVELIGPDLFASLAGPKNKALISKLATPTVLHICGDTTAILEEMEATGAKGISVDPLVSRQVAKEKLKRAVLVGNLNPVDTLLFGDEGMVLGEAQECVKEGVGVLAPGCGISPRTPTKNILAYTNYAKSLN